MFPPPTGFKNGRVRPHTCHLCQNIFPGEPEKIFFAGYGTPNTPIDRYRWTSQNVNRLGVALTDLRAWTEENCEFARYFCEQVEKSGRFKDEVTEAVHLFTNTDQSSWLLQGLVHLRSVREMQGLPLGIDGEDYYVPEIELNCYVTVDEGDHPGYRVPIVKGIARDPLSSETASSIRAWLSFCETQSDDIHKVCSVTEAPCIPRRLIALNKRKSSTRLNLVNDIDVRSQHPVRYAALSYCWGGLQEKQLTRANRVSYEENITWRTLPKTLQDAVSTTRQLGLHFLWIDSLCIVQDDDDDKSQCISQMAKVYTHATVTIFNRRGDRVSHGFLHSRSALPGTTYVKYEDKRGNLGWAILYFDEALAIDDKGRLDSRGWTFQEQILSRRHLSFGPRCTEWSCRTGKEENKDGWRAGHGMQHDYSLPLEILETYGIKKLRYATESLEFKNITDTMVFSSVNPGIQLETPPVAAFCSEWRRLVRHYSKRSLTVSRDRVFAIAGLAESFALGMVGAQRYIAGIWECDLPRALLWDRSQYVTSTRLDRSTRYRGPTWSWISIEGEVDYLGDLSGSTFLCTWHSVMYELENDRAPFGALIGASLHITGPTISMKWLYIRDQDADSTHDISEFRWREVIPKLGQTDFNLDAREHSTDWKGVSLLCVATNQVLGVMVLHGLILIRCGNDTGHGDNTSFRRLGSFRRTDNDDFYPQLKEWSIESFCVV